MHVRVTMTDTAPSLLQGIKSRVPSIAAMGALASKGEQIIEMRTLSGKDESGAPFEPYRTEPYYAPVENRPPGYPEPSGGTPSRTGKTMRYDSFASYKQAMGFGGTPQLSISNQMLSDIDWVVKSKTRALLFLTSRLSAAKAHGHDTGYYPFFGLGDARSEAQMDDELLEIYREAHRQALAELKARRSRSR